MGTPAAARNLQWGGRFAAAPDAALLEFGRSLEDDLILAPFDLATSRAHVATLAAAGTIDVAQAHALERALATVEAEIESDEFAATARANGAEDVHGAIDARVRALAGEAGEWLHAGRSRNDQVATTLALYVRDRARRGAEGCRAIARTLLAGAKAAAEEGTLLAATTHWQPAQPVLLGFWIAAAAESFARAAARFEDVSRAAARFCPLGSGACSGTSLPLDRAVGARELDFGEPSRNALDAVGDRDAALDLLHAVTRATLAAARVGEELVLWCTPAFGYVRLGDEASTGSSLMPQKRNPDPFELIRARAARVAGILGAALATVKGIALSYHRDLQETKALVMQGTELGLAALDAFAAAWPHVHWNTERLNARAGEGFTVATDIADALVKRGVTARRAHELVGNVVSAAEAAGRDLRASDLATLAKAAGLKTLEAPLDPRAAVEAKATSGSTNPDALARSIAGLEAELQAR